MFQDTLKGHFFGTIFRVWLGQLYLVLNEYSLNIQDFLLNYIISHHRLVSFITETQKRVSTPEEYLDRVVYIAMYIVSISSTIHNSNGNAREIISQKSSRAICIIFVLERVSTPEEEDADADTDRGSWPLTHLTNKFKNTS